MEDHESEKTSQEAIEQTGEKPNAPAKTPPGGPHASRNLIDKSKTPGSGVLPDSQQESVEPGAG